MTTPTTFKHGYPTLKYSQLPVIMAESDPTTSDLYHPTAGGYYPIPTLWVNKTNDKAFVLTSISSGTTANWNGITDAATGNVVGPASSTDNALARFDATTGKIIQNSVAILSDAGVLTGLTSVSSPIYTVAAATDMDINAASGQDIDVTFGDAAGTNNVSFFSDTPALVASINSLGQLTVPTIITLAGNNMQFNAAVGFNFIMRAGDDAGANFFIWEDSAGLDLMNLDSDGQLNLLTGDFVESRSAASAEVLHQVTNSDNTAADSDAFYEVAVGGTSGGNPGVRFQISGGQNYSMGIDNASASDDLLICGDNDIGTDPLVRIQEAGDVLAEKGNLAVNAAGKQLQVHGGAVTDFIGTATLASGTVTIANTNIASTDRIFLQRQDINGSTAVGSLTYSISAGASFTITSVQDASPASTQTNDASIVSYFIVRELA